MLDHYLILYTFLFDTEGFRVYVLPIHKHHHEHLLYSTTEGMKGRTSFGPVKNMEKPSFITV